MGEHRLYPEDETRHVLAFLAAFQKRHGWMPSYEEIQAGRGYASKSSVARHLEQLEQSGHIVRGPHGASRCIRIVKKEMETTT